jgi:cold shock protein
VSEGSLLLNRQKDHRPRQPRSWNEDDTGLLGNAGGPSPFPTFSASPSAPEEAATVNWYNPEKGFGFVALADGRGDAFLHHSALRASGLQSVPEGALLKVRVSKGQKGQQVDEILSVSEGSGTAPSPRRPQGARPDRNDRPRREVNLSDVTEVVGVVKWYSAQKGFGFVSAETGGKDVFVHATALQRAGLTTLNEGQSVRMGVVAGSKGPEAASISLA